MSVVKADRFTALKARVKAEVQRRNQSGSVASYAGSAYDYTVAPGPGKTIRAEHRDKLVTPLRAVNSDVVPASAGAAVKDSELANLETRVTAWSARSMTDRSGSDCKSGCTGTCYTGCATGCYSCGSGCPNSCSGCGFGCDGCKGCGSSCSDDCTSSCSGNCGTSCSNNCQAECATSCKDGCYTNCKGTCEGECSQVCSKGCGSMANVGL